jgi:hypothetical protein
MDSNPTPRAKHLDSSEDLNSIKKQNNIVKGLQEQIREINSTSQNKEED